MSKRRPDSKKQTEQNKARWMALWSSSPVEDTAPTEFQHKLFKANSSYSHVMLLISHLILFYVGAAQRTQPKIPTRFR